MLRVTVEISPSFSAGLISLLLLSQATLMLVKPAPSSSRPVFSSFVGQGSEVSLSQNLSKSPKVRSQWVTLEHMFILEPARVTLQMGGTLWLTALDQLWVLRVRVGLGPLLNQWTEGGNHSPEKGEVMLNRRPH